MKALKGLLLYLVLSSVLLSSASAMEHEIVNEDYLDYALQYDLNQSPIVSYRLSWQPVDDVHAYHIAVIREIAGREENVVSVESANGIAFPTEVRDGAGNAYAMPVAFGESVVLPGDATEIDLAALILSLSEMYEVDATHPILGYYCYVMIIPKEGMPITQLIALPYVSEGAGASADSADFTAEVDDDTRIAIAQIISEWTQQYPDHFSRGDVPPADLSTGVDMVDATETALIYIVDAYDFALAQLEIATPEALYSAFEDAFIVHVMPRNQEEVFSITVDFETGAIVDAQYAGPTE